MESPMFGLSHLFKNKAAQTPSSLKPQAQERSHFSKHRSLEQLLQLKCLQGAEDMGIRAKCLL